MRKYSDEKKPELEQVVCNRCGRNLRVENGILKEGGFHVDAVFGYFSKKDGMRHKFDICENCYDEMTAVFVLPVSEEQESEML